MKITCKGVEGAFEVGDGVMQALDLFGEQNVFDMYVKGCRQNLRQYKTTHGAEKTLAEWKVGEGVRRPKSKVTKQVEAYKASTPEERSQFLTAIKDVK